MDIRVAGIIRESVVDGPGFRYVVFAQGCSHGCKGCHNPETHDTKGGSLVDADKLLEDARSSKHIDGITFSGGEPFLQAKAFAYMAEKLKRSHTHIVCYTGFTFEQILSSSDPDWITLLSNVDILIDGPYIEAQRDLGLNFRGSKNQRIIDVKRSLALSGKTGISEDEAVC